MWREHLWIFFSTTPSLPCRHKQWKPGMPALSSQTLSGKCRNFDGIFITRKLSIWHIRVQPMMKTFPGPKHDIERTFKYFSMRRAPLSFVYTENIHTSPQPASFDSLELIRKCRNFDKIVHHCLHGNWFWQIRVQPGDEHFIKKWQHFHFQWEASRQILVFIAREITWRRYWSPKLLRYLYYMGVCWGPGFHTAMTYDAAPYATALVSWNDRRTPHAGPADTVIARHILCHSSS